MTPKLKQEGKFEYLETGGPGEPLMLLHGLFGGLSNFGAQIDHFKKDCPNFLKKSKAKQVKTSQEEEENDIFKLDSIYEVVNNQK